MEHQIDVHQGREPSLWDEKQYRELAQAVGDELLAGAFVIPENVLTNWTTLEYSQTVGITGYAPEADGWESLKAYSVAIVGYSVSNGTREYEDCPTLR